MTFKTIFAPLAFEETAKLVSETALLLAGAFKGHVMAQHVLSLIHISEPTRPY